jgi:ABC-2 type transport system permease protein
MKLLVMLLVAAGFWAAIMFGFVKALAYFKAVEGFGQVLAQKLMGMVWLTFFALLVFSNIITTLSTFFLSKDLETIHASPTSLESIFWARFTATLVDSSWMVVFFGLPVFLAYGLVFKAGAVYYLHLVAVVVPFLVLSGAVA